MKNVKIIAKGILATSVIDVSEKLGNLKAGIGKFQNALLTEDYNKILSAAKGLVLSANLIKSAVVLAKNEWKR
jgi:hypothetical protein